uniref:Cytochrome P450 n=1 Tax=Bionectria ochroleuca TaxID=29856 RepID=A0A8H7N6U1_BIOOC
MDSLDGTVTKSWVLVLAVAALAIFSFITNSTTVSQGNDPPIPKAGPYRVLPRAVLSLLYSVNAVKLLQSAYEKFKKSAFLVIRNDGEITVLPQSLLEELAAIPVSVANPQAALERDLLGHFTGVDLILENRLHHWIVQRRLTPKLPLLTPRMEKAVTESFDKLFPKGDEWVEFQPYQILGRVSARVAADAMVGPAFCTNEAWLDIAFNYTENLFRTIVVLRTVPNWMQRFLAPLLPSYWHGQKYLKSAKNLLGPKISQLMEQNDLGLWEPKDDNADDANLMSWLSSMTKGKDRDPDTISHVLVLVALASVHTTLLRMVNVLYDVTAAGSALRDELQEEIMAAVDDGWSAQSYDRLQKLDSVLRESQRMSPPTMLGLKRLFQKSHTFSDGTHVKAGSYVCMPIHAIENDPQHTPNPQEFDGLRSFRARAEQENSANIDKAAIKEFLFSTPTKTILGFGYGKLPVLGVSLPAMSLRWSW